MFEDEQGNVCEGNQKGELGDKNDRCTLQKVNNIPSMSSLATQRTIICRLWIVKEECGAVETMTWQLGVGHTNDTLT